MRRPTTAASLLLSTGLLGCGTKGQDQATQDTVRAGGEVGNAQLASAGNAPAGQSVGNPEPVALFTGPMPTGVAVSREGRIFVNFPKWGDDVDFTVAEIKGGRAIPYPSAAINRYEKGRETDTLVSVQSVVIDPANRLWILDTGTIRMGPVIDNGPKLVCVDLSTNQVVRTIPFPNSVAHENAYLNDVRFDLRRGAAGVAFITDSSEKGPNGIVVVDLDTGESWRRLNDHPSTRAVPDFVPTVEGEPFMVRPPTGPAQPIRIGSDGIAISADGQQLYYCPLASRHLFTVSTEALADRSADDAAVAATVKDLGDRGFASDGLEQDAQGRIYLTDYENNAIRRSTTDGRYEIIAQDPRMIWPDTLSVAADGYVYCIAN